MRVNTKTQLYFLLLCYLSCYQWRNAYCDKALVSSTLVSDGQSSNFSKTLREDVVSKDRLIGEQDTDSESGAPISYTVAEAKKDGATESFSQSPNQGGPLQSADSVVQGEGLVPIDNRSVVASLSSSGTLTAELVPHDKSLPASRNDDHVSKSPPKSGVEEDSNVVEENEHSIDNQNLQENMPWSDDIPAKPVVESESVIASSDESWSSNVPSTHHKSAGPAEAESIVTLNSGYMSESHQIADSEDEPGQSDLEKKSILKDDSEDVLELSVDCEKVAAFPTSVFHEQSDASKVYLYTSPMDDALFAPLGFDKYLMVFGVPVLGTKLVKDAELLHAGKIFAGFLDNDSDGVPDRQSALEAVQGFQTVIGYVGGPSESEEFWSARFEAPEAGLFRDQFACNMHFFEHWATDLTPEFYDNSSKTDNSNPTAICDSKKAVDFDWPLWYFPFTISYYGYIEDFEENILEAIRRAIERARESGKFLGTYSDDPEMEIADFFVWSLLTKLGALECHCKADVIADVWQVCTAEELREDDEWFDILSNRIEGLPTRLPSPSYSSSAVVQIQVEESMY